MKSVNQGSSLVTQCPEFLMGAGHLGPVCLALLKIRTPRRKADIQYKLYWLHKLFRHSEPFLLGDDGENPRVQKPTKDQPCK